MRLTARCIFGTLLAVSSLSWITAASGEEDSPGDEGFGPCAATLTPEGPCKDEEEETTCPYLFRLPPMTINLPLRIRELEQIVEDLQKLKDNVDQLRKMCADCTVSQTERECGRQTDTEHEKLHERLATREDGMVLMNDTRVEIVKKNERHECGTNGVKTANTVKDDDDTASEKRDRLKDSERKIWESKRETNKTIVKEKEKEETLREVPEKDGKTHRKVDGVKGEGELVQTQVPAGGRNEGRVEREEVVDKNHEDTETDGDKVENSKGSREDTSEKKHPSKDRNGEKTEESDHHVWQDETKETEKKTQTEDDRTGDRIKMSVDDDEHIKQGREQHREERKKEKEKRVKTEHNKEKPKHTESTQLTGEDRETEKKSTTGGQNSVQVEQSSSDGVLKSNKTIERTGLFSDSLTPHSTTDLTSSPKFTDLDVAVTFTSSPSLPSRVSHSITDVDHDVKKTADGLKSKSTNFIDAGSTEYPSFDSDSGFRTTSRPVAATPVSPLEDTGQKANGATIRVTSTTSTDKGSSTKTTSIPTTPRQTYTPTFSAVTDHSRRTSKKNISSTPKTGVKPTQSKDPKHSEKHKPGIRPEADPTLKHPKNDRKLVQAPLPDRKTNNDQRQKPPRQKPTTDQKSTPVKSPKPGQIPKHDQRPQPHNLPTDEGQKNEQILKNDQVQTTGQNELPTLKPQSHDKPLPPVQRPTSQKKPVDLNTTNYKDPASEHQPISDEITTQSPDADKITIHSPKTGRPDPGKNPGNKVNSEENAKSDRRSNQYFTPVGNTESEISPMSSITPNPNENALNEQKENDQNPPLEPHVFVQVSTPTPKTTPDVTDVQLQPKPNQPKPGQNVTKINQRPKPGQNIPKINQKPKPGQNVTKISQKPKPGQNIPKINQKPKPGQNVTKISQKLKPGQNVTKINQKPKPGQNIPKINQKPKAGQNVTKISQKPKPGQSVPKIDQKPKPGQNITKITQKPKPEHVPKINQKHPKVETDQKTQLKPKPEPSPEDHFETPDLDQIPGAQSNTTSKRWPPPGLRPSTRPVFSPGATPVPKLKPEGQSESTPKTKTDLDPTFISGVTSESTHHTETGIQPTSGPIKQSTEVAHSQRGTEFSPSDRKPSPLGPKTSNTLDPDPSPHLNMLPEGFTMSPTDRLKSDLRPQATPQPPSVLWTTRPKTVIGGSSKGLMSSTTPRSTHLSSTTDSRSQSKLFDHEDKTGSSQTTTLVKTTTSVPSPSVQTTSTVGSDFRSNQYFIPIEKTKSETSTSSVTPNPNENHVSGFKEKDQSPSAESNISVQGSTSGPKPTPDRTDTKLKLKPKQQVPEINQKPKPGQNITKINQKSKPGQNVPKINQKPKPGQNVTKIIQKPKPGQNIPKINQKPKPGQNITKIFQKPKPGQNVPMINQKPKPGQNVTKITQKPKPGQNVPNINQKPKPGQNVTKITQKPKPEHVPKINQKHPKVETDQKTQLKPKPEPAPEDNFETPDPNQIPGAQSNTTSKRWPPPGLRPSTRPVFSPGATPVPKLKPEVQSESTPKTKTDLDPTFISGVTSESTHHTETGIQPTSGPIKQSTEVAHSQRGTEFSPSDRKPSPLGPKTSNTLDPEPSPHLNTLPEGFTMSPTDRIKSDLRPQSTIQSLLVPTTTRSNKIFGGTLKSLMSTTVPRTTSLSFNTDSKSQSKISEKVGEIESSWTKTPDKTTTSVPFPGVQTTSTVGSDFRSTTTPTSAFTSKQTFTSIEETESETKTRSITPNPNENNVSEFKESDYSPSAEPNISVQGSTSGPKPTPDGTDTKLKLKPKQQIPKINQKPKPGQNITKINQKPKPGQNIPKINQKPKPGQNITKINQKPKPGQNVPKINQKPKPGQNVPKINQKPKPGQSVPKINQKPRPGQLPKIDQKHPKVEKDKKTQLKPKPEPAPEDHFETPDHDQIPGAQSNTTSKQWPPPGLRPSTRPVFSPGATPVPKLKPEVQSESTPKTKTDLDPTFISRVTSESTHHTETGIQPTSGPIKQSTEVAHSQRGTEFSPSDRKPSPLGPKTSNTLDPDPSPHLNTLPEGFTMSPTDRIKSDLRPQSTAQPPSVLWTTRPKTVIGGSSKGLMSSTTPRSTHLSSSTDSRSQSKVFDHEDKTGSSQTRTPDKTTTSVPFPGVQTTSTVGSDFRSTTTPTSAFTSKQTFTSIEETESETSTRSITPNPNENNVSEFKESDYSPSAEPNVSVQGSTSGSKPTPDGTDTKLKLKPKQQIPKINQKPKPGQNITKINQKPKPGQNIPKINQKPKPDHVPKINQKPKPGQNITKITQKPKPRQNVPKINQKPKPGQNITKIFQKPKPGQNVTKITQKPKPEHVPKINQKHPKVETDQKTKLKPKPEPAPEDNFETTDPNQIPGAQSNTTSKRWPPPGLRPSTRPVFSPGATPVPKLKPEVQSESIPKTKTDLDPTFISGVTSESTHHTETGIQPTSGPIKQSTEVAHSQRGTEFSPSDRKPSLLGPKTSNTLDPEPSPHLNALPEGFAMSPTDRIKSDLRPQSTIQSLLVPTTTRSNKIFGGTLKSLMSTTVPRTTSLSFNTDSKSQSKISEKVDEIESSWTKTPDETTTSVSFPGVQTTSTVGSDFRSTTTPTSAFTSKQTFTSIEETESETKTRSITPNPNENNVSEFKESDYSPSAEPNISVQGSTSGPKPTPDGTDTKLKLKPKQQIPKINQKPKPGQNITKINQKPKPGQNIPKINQKPKPGQNVTKMIQKPKPGQNVPKINQKPKPGQNGTKIIQKPKPGQNVTKITQKPKPEHVPKINQKHPKVETDQKTQLKPKPEPSPEDHFETPDLDQIPGAQSNTTSKQWPPPGLRPSTRPVFSPGATPVPKLKPEVQSESTPKTKTGLDPTFISRVTSESTHHTETGIQPTSGPIKQSTEVAHSQRGTEFSPSDRKPSPLGPKTSNTLDPDPSPHLNTLPEGFTMSPTDRIKSDLRPQSTAQPPSVLWTTRPKTVIGGSSKGLMSSTTPRSTHLSSTTDSRSQSKVFDHEDKTGSSPTTTPDKTTTPVPPPSVQTTSTVGSDFRSTTTPTSDPEAPAEASTPTARELRVKINQVAAFLNNSMNPKLRPPDTTSKEHPEVDGKASNFSTFTPKVIRDCSDHLLRGRTQNGVYMVTPDLRSRSFSVFCDMQLNGGGWTVLQLRKDGSVDFNRLWDDYRDGFGNLNGGEFWLGNNLIHLLTRERDMVLRVELEDFDGVMEFAEYEHFKVASERMRFRLTVSGYSGTAGDALRYSKRYDHNNKAFTTPDRDHDRYPSGNCGAYYSSGWWFDSCMAANLNGKYYTGRYKGVRDGIFWGTWHNISTEYYPTNERQSFKSARMMIRPKGFMP